MEKEKEIERLTKKKIDLELHRVRIGVKVVEIQREIMDLLRDKGSEK